MAVALPPAGRVCRWCQRGDGHPSVPAGPPPGGPGRAAIGSRRRRLRLEPDAVPHPCSDSSRVSPRSPSPPRSARRHLVRDPATGLLSPERLQRGAASGGGPELPLRLDLHRDGAAGRCRSSRPNGRSAASAHAFGRALRTGDTGARLRQRDIRGAAPQRHRRVAPRAGRPVLRGVGGMPSSRCSSPSATAPKDSVDPAELFRLAVSRLHEDVNRSRTTSRGSTRA